MNWLTKSWNWIISKLPKKKKPFAGIKQEIRYAFTCGGVDYYEFADPFNIPPHRGYALFLEWSLMKAKITEEYLNNHAEANDAILKKDHKNVFETKTDFKKVNDQLKERMRFLAFDVENLYRVAAVHFFDKNESPEIYDKDHALVKIASWRRHATIEDFFLQLPIVRLFPFLQGQEENLKSYDQVVNQLNNLHLENLSQIISNK